MMTQPGSDKKYRTITLEEHFATPEFMQGPGREMSSHGNQGERKHQSAHERPSENGK